jgi:type VI secretion system protein ImpA
MRDVTALLDPIPGDSPAGPDLRYAGLYDTLQELRREDDSTAPRGIWQTKLKAADWSGLIDAASDALATQTKDLQIGVWLAEALVARDGVASAPRGFDALAVLVEHFWPVLWPQIGEEDDLDARLAPLDWLDSKLPARFALTEIAESDPPVTWHLYLSTQRALAIPGANKGKGEKPSKTMEGLMQLVDQTPSAFYQQRAAELGAAIGAVSRLKAQLRAQCADAAPSFSKIGGSLAALQGFIRAELIKRGLPVEAPPADEAPPPQPEEMMMPDDINEPATIAEAEEALASEETPPPAAAPAGGSGPLVLRDRAHAYRVLTQVAQYLERTEPHSPVPHLIMRAVAWGGMSLPELLDEILREDTNSIYRLLGLGNQGGGDGGDGGGGPKRPRTPRG